MPGPADLGFAEFAASLLRETAAAVVAAHAEQEERLRDLAEASTLTPEEFAVLIPPAEVDAALAALLPGDDGGTSAVAGGPVPDEKVLAALELELDKTHTKGAQLTEAGAEAVRTAVAEHLAERQLSAIRESRRLGVPRVIVDGGSVSAKITYSFVEEDGKGAPPTKPRIERPPVLAPRLAKLRPDVAARLPGALSGVRLRVKPAAPETVQDSTVRADVFGEVRLSFRTVV